MKALILSNDSEFAAKARSILQRVGRRPAVTVRWTIKTWSIESLRHANLSEKALFEGADAHLIVIPEAYARSLPLYLRDWLDRWAARRRIEDAGVGIIGDALSADLTKEVSLEFRLWVERHGLNLITNDASVASRASAKLRISFSAENMQTLPIRLAHLPYMSTPDPFWAFGINE